MAEGTTAGVAAGDRAAAPRVDPEPRTRKHRSFGTAMLFLLPALLLLGGLVVYPIVFSVGRSFYDAAGSEFVGSRNYGRMFSAESTLTAIRNNLIWVVVAPTVVTALGLIFAVLTERIRWSTAFKVLIFMPMAISFLSAGVTWRLIYEQDPDIGVANAAVGAVADVVRPPGALPGARASDEEAITTTDGALQTAETVAPGEAVAIGLVAIPPDQIPSDATTAAEPQPVDGAVAGTVWVDFTAGGGGESGRVDPQERGLPGVTVEAVDANGAVVASTTTAPDGTFALEGVSGGDVSVRLAASNFREPF